MTDDKNTHYACTHCRTTKLIPKSLFTNYYKTNDEKVLINAFYGKIPSYEFNSSDRYNLFRPCACQNNKWVRLTHYGVVDTHKEILTLENGHTEKTRMIVTKVSNEEFFEFITSNKFGNPVLASGFKLLKASNGKMKED